MANIEKIVNEVRKAQEVFATFSQEQVDHIFYHAAKAANDQRIALAKMAVSETQMGIIEDKVLKNHVASEYIYNKYRYTQTVGVYDEDSGLGYEEMYAPMGVIGAVIPTTNPTSTAIFKTLISLKTRNGIIISPHPRARQCTIAAAKIILDAAVEAGAPKGIIAWLPDDAKLENTGTLMSAVDMILATGGPGLVKAAYSSGKPAIGVGAGNCPAIIDSTADIPMAVASITQSNTFDNGVVCATENSVIVLAEVYDEFVAEVAKQSSLVVNNKKDVAAIEAKMFRENKFGVLNPEIVGQTPQSLAKIFGIKVDPSVKMMFVEAKGTTYNDALAHEKLSTFVSLYKAKTFDQALEMQSELLLLGPGHTASLFCDEFASTDKINKFKNSAKASRLVVNSPSSLGGVGDIYNFHLAPSFTLGCGTWGGNSISGNIGPMNLLNTKTVAKRRENMLWMRIPDRVYYKFGCISIAFDDFKQAGMKKAFVVSDAMIWSLYGKKISKILDSIGMKYEVFAEVLPNPTLENTMQGTKRIEAFQPDLIIAVGGGSALDAAKLMWLFYEEPTANFADLALRFADIRKRIVRFPEMGKKAKLACIPTTAGTGSEVTPFAVITDEKTHIKYPLADYALTPNYAIVDSELMLSLPKGMTAATGADALTHAIESYVSVLATEFTEANSLKAIELVFKYLKRAVESGTTDKEAREGMAHASTIAGIAFSNAFLGVVHSLSHKVGGHHGVIHGIANAIYLPYSIAYNAEKGVREKQMYFPQYKTHNVAERYAEIADWLHLGGKTTEDKVDRLIKALQDLFKSIKIPASTKDYGVDSKKFYATLDSMSEEAFDDQCTGANPRYPSIEDMKTLYTLGHEGTPIKKLAKTSK